jgi:hypothetical protein
MGISPERMNELAELAVADEIRVGADHLEDDEVFWAQVRRMLGAEPHPVLGYTTRARLVVSACDAAIARRRDPMRKLCYLTLREAAKRRAL